MKITLLVHPIQDWGGLLMHTEELFGGLRECGHNVELKCCRWSKPFKGKSRYTRTPTHIGPSGIPSEIRYGWQFRSDHCLYYKDGDNRIQVRDYLASRDLLIWCVPVPTRQRANEGNIVWVGLYDVPVLQVALVCDMDTPWLHEVQNHLTALAAVHPAAYSTAAQYALPRACIVSPQDLQNLYGKYDFPSRRRGWFSCQIGKSWKHIDDLVRSVPYMSDLDDMILGGQGGELMYMQSKSKCQFKYYVQREHDPDAPADAIGKVRIWDRALAAGMLFLGGVPQWQMSHHRRLARVVIDPSWSKKTALLGDRFNRVAVEAAMDGAIPIGRNFGMSARRDGIGILFRPDENYIMIPHDATPKHFAEIVMEACNMPDAQARAIIERNYELCKQFDRRLVAEQYIELAQLKPTGIFNKLEVGENDPTIIAESKFAIEHGLQTRRSILKTSTIDIFAQGKL